MSSSISASFGLRPVSTGDLPDVWLNMEQIMPPGAEIGLGYADIIQMISRARSGLSAHTYQREGCEVTVEGETVTFPLDFHVWPSSLDLVYGLTVSGPGLLEEREQVQVEKEDNVIFPLRDYGEVDQLIGNLDRWEWETPLYNAFGQVMGMQGPVVENNLLRVSSPCFGVMRAVYHAAGFKHRLLVSLEKPTEEMVEDLEIIVTASWTDEQGKEQDKDLELEIPQCVLDYLSFCPGGERLPRKEEEEEKPVIYYSGCSGKVLGVRYEQ